MNIKLTNVAGFLRFFVLTTLILFSGIHQGEAATFGAELGELEGTVLVTKKDTGETVKATDGMRVGPGDRVETKEDGTVEIIYDDGNITDLDENTIVTIEKLSIEDDKTVITIIKLGIGKIKNSVTKLSGRRARFEVHTKNGVAGVKGTPPFIVAVIPPAGGEPEKMEVDLLGRPNDEGAVEVTTVVGGIESERFAANNLILSDAAPIVVAVAKKHTVRLTSRTRTVAVRGQPPRKPFRISPKRFRQHTLTMRITTSAKKLEKKKKEMTKRVEDVAKSAESKKSKEQSKEGEQETKEKDLKEKETKTEEKKEKDTTDKTETEPKGSETADKGSKEQEKKDSGESDTATSTEVKEVKKEEPSPEAKEPPPVELAGGSQVELQAETAGEPPPTSPEPLPTAQAPPPQSQPPPAPGTESLMNLGTRNVSVPNVMQVGESAAGETSESQLSMGETSVSGAGESVVPPTATVNIRIGIIRK